MKLKYLLEIADKILPYNINLSDEKGIIGSFNSAGDHYFIYANKQYDKFEKKTINELGFGSKKGKHLSAKSRNQPELKNVFEVMATVKDVIRKYIKKFKPKFITFSLFDNIKSRTNVYSKILKSLGYEEIESDFNIHLFQKK